MPTKTTKSAQKYQVDGKAFIWTTEDGDTITIPLRIKLKVIRGMAGRELDADAMFDMLDKLVPDQSDAIDEMDLNDFQAMFSAWQSEYESLSGATLGE